MDKKHNKEKERMKCKNLYCGKSFYKPFTWLNWDCRRFVISFAQRFFTSIDAGWKVKCIEILCFYITKKCQLGDYPFFTVLIKLLKAAYPWVTETANDVA